LAAGNEGKHIERGSTSTIAQGEQKVGWPS